MQGSQGHHRGPVCCKKGSSLPPRAHHRDVFIEMQMLWVTSNLPVAQVDPLPSEVGQANDPSGADGLPSGKRKPSEKRPPVPRHRRWCEVSLRNPQDHGVS